MVPPKGGLCSLARSLELGQGTRPAARIGQSPNLLDQEPKAPFHVAERDGIMARVAVSAPRVDGLRYRWHASWEAPAWPLRFPHAGASHDARVRQSASLTGL